MNPKKTEKVWGDGGIIQSLFRNRLFLAGLVIKLLLGLLFASDYITALFAPFIKSALQHNFWHIYNDYYTINSKAFPYPPVMLYILALPRYIASAVWSASGPVSFVDVFCIRLPVLVADMVIMVVLIKWLKNLKQVVKWYWLSPIIIYISYIHGQLDMIPTSLFCVALFFLFKDRYKYFAVFLVLACATKFHIVITFPFILIYLYRVKKLEIVSLSRGVPAIILMLILVNLPFLLQLGFIKMVYQNQEQGKVFTSYFGLFENYRLYFIPASYMVFLYTMFDFKFINKDILLIFLALGFGIFTFFLVPQPGWYLWNMPFFVYFLVRFKSEAKHLFILINITYFLFFVIYPLSDIPRVAQLFLPEAATYQNIHQILISHGISAYVLVQLSFTLLQVSLLIFLIALFRLGVLQVSRFKIYNQPYLIGICGDSGSGKTTLTKAITDLFGSMTLVVRGDDMHRWERGHEKWNEFTHLNPKANWLHRDLADLIELKAGRSIKRKAYDHDSGKFTDFFSVNSNKVVIYEGLHSFYLREASKIYDLKIFMKPSETLRRYWKIERDVKTRGYNADAVIEAIEKRITDANNHVLIQESEADIVFSVEGFTDDMNQRNIGLYLKVSSSNDIFFEYLLDYLKTMAALEIKHDINRNGQQITLQGKIGRKQIERIADELQLDIRETIGNKPVWQDNYFGIMQLFVVYAMFTQLKRTGMLLENEVN